MTTLTQPIIVDTNILLSALLSRQSRFAEIILETDRKFYICEYVIVELFKHKEKIASSSRMAENDLLLMYYTLLKKVIVSKEEMISPANRRIAIEFCQSVDAADTPHVALTLELGGLLWTGDKKLKMGLQAKGFDQFFEPQSKI